MLAVNFLVVKLDLSLIFCKIVIILLIIAYLFNLLIYFHLLFESYFLFLLLLNQQLFHFVNFSSEYHPLCNFCLCISSLLFFQFLTCSQRSVFILNQIFN
jgi:hypothetical protein